MRFIFILLFLSLLVNVCINNVYADDINVMRKFADSGNSYAQYKVGKYYYESGKEDTGKVYLQRACDGKYNPACEYGWLKMGLNFSTVLQQASGFGGAGDYWFGTSIGTPILMGISGVPGAAAIQILKMTDGNNKAKEPPVKK